MLERKELIDLIEQIKNFEGTEEEEDILFKKLPDFRRCLLSKGFLR